MKLFSYTKNLALAIPTVGFAYALLFTGSVNYPLPASAQNSISLEIRFKSPSGSGGGSPYNTSTTAGTSGPCTANTGEGELTALVPLYENQGLTTDPIPTFWFYVPFEGSHTLKFVLQDKDYQTIKEFPLTRNSEAGVVNFRLPSEHALSPEIYRWQFIVACEEGNSKVRFFVEGAIEYNPDLVSSSELAGKTPLEQAAIYAGKGVWFEALTILGNLYRSDPSVAEQWQSLLNSEDVELGNIATKSLINCCQL